MRPSTPRASHGLGAGLRLLAGAAAATLAVSFMPDRAAAQEDGDRAASERVAGVTRFETAAAIALETFDEAASAVIATGEDFPDALAASYAAGSVGGPVLLVGSDGVPDATWEALDALDVQTAVLIGGTPVAGRRNRWMKPSTNWARSGSSSSAAPRR